MKRAITIQYYRKQFFGFHELTEDWIAAALLEEKHIKKAWEMFTKDNGTSLTTENYHFFFEKYGDRENGIVTVYKYLETGTGYDEMKMDRPHARKLFTEDANKARQDYENEGRQSA